MKTLSGTVGFVALAVIAIVTLPSCCRKEVSEEALLDSNKKLTLKFGKKVGAETEYVEVDKTAFDKALCALKASGGQYEVEFLADAKASPTPGYTPSCSPVSINTDKITTSELAKNAPAEESSAYDPNVTFRVSSNSATDIKNVLDTFK
jgi:hypothetical protein